MKSVIIAILFLTFGKIGQAQQSASDSLIRVMGEIRDHSSDAPARLCHHQYPGACRANLFAKQWGVYSLFTGTCIRGHPGCLLYRVHNL